MVNKYKGTCIECKAVVGPQEGQARKSKAGRWYVLCLEHIGPSSAPGRRHASYRPVGSRYREDEPGHVYARFAGGAEVYRNARGRCEDAPCCGCCS